MLGVDPLTDMAFRLFRVQGHSLLVFLGLITPLEEEAGGPHLDLVPVLQRVFLDGSSPEVGPVQGPEVFEQVCAVGELVDFGVFLRNHRIEELDGIVGMSAQGGKGGEIKLPGLVPRDYGQLRFAQGPSIAGSKGLEHSGHHGQRLLSTGSVGVEHDDGDVVEPSP